MTGQQAQSSALQEKKSKCVDFAIREDPKCPAPRGAIF